jgi:metal-responsive CopG/Arc/MetJ family transcriptional regulator
MVQVTLDLPEKLIKDMDFIEKLYGTGREEIMLSALKRYLDKQRQLFSEAMNRKTIR